MQKISTKFRQEHPKRRRQMQVESESEESDVDVYVTKCNVFLR